MIIPLGNRLKVVRETPEATSARIRSEIQRITEMNDKGEITAFGFVILKKKGAEPHEIGLRGAPDSDKVDTKMLLEVLWDHIEEQVDD